MKKHTFIIIIITLGLFLSVYKSYSKDLKTMDFKSLFTKSPATFGELWAEVNALENKGKTNEAYKKVKEILAKAKRKKTIRK